MTLFKLCKVFNILSSITAVLVLFFLASCEKDLPPTPGERLVKIIKSERDSIGIVLFNYNESDQLVNISHTLNNMPSYQTNLFYDNLGKLLRSEEHFIPANSTWTATYTYNTDLITSKIATDGQGNTNNNDYSYNAQAQLIADTAHQSWNPFHDYKSLHYNPDGNVEEVKYFYNSSGTWQKVGSISFMYNNASNPLKSIGLLYSIVNSFDVDRYIYFSKNLISQQITPSETFDYTYEYHSNGLPKKVIIKSNQPGGEQSTTEFFYE